MPGTTTSARQNTSPQAPPNPVATTPSRKSVINNGVVDLDGVQRGADEIVENCGSMQTFSFIMWVRYDNGDTARFTYTIKPNPEAVPTSGWRFDPWGLPLAHRIVTDFDSGLPYMRCSSY